MSADSQFADVKPDRNGVIDYNGVLDQIAADRDRTYRVSYTAEQLMKLVSDVRDNLRDGAGSLASGEVDMNRIVGAWVAEREKNEAIRSLTSALATVVVHAPFASGLYHEAGFELLNQFEEIERNA